MNEKKNIGSLFDRIAKHYDFLNHLLSLNIDKRWRRKAVSSLPHQDKQTCLDVAIGTADLSIELLRQAPDTTIQGIDLSSEMMNIGKEKVQEKGLDSSVSFINASALDMPFEDNSFDIVMCGYGVRNFSDLDKGLSEMQRVLKPEGQLMILEFSYPDNRLIAWAYDIYFSHILPLVGRVVSKDKSAYSYLNKSVKTFVWGDKMKQRIEQAGFSACTYKPLTFGITTIYTATKEVRGRTKSLIL